MSAYRGAAGAGARRHDGGWSSPRRARRERTGGRGWSRCRCSCRGPPVRPEALLQQDLLCSVQHGTSDFGLLGRELRPGRQPALDDVAGGGFFSLGVDSSLGPRRIARQPHKLCDGADPVGAVLVDDGQLANEREDHDGGRPRAAVLSREPDCRRDPDGPRQRVAHRAARPCRRFEPHQLPPPGLNGRKEKVEPLPERKPEGEPRTFVRHSPPSLKVVFSSFMICLRRDAILSLRIFSARARAPPQESAPPLGSHESFIKAPGSRHQRYPSVTASEATSRTRMPRDRAYFVIQIFIDSSASCNTPLRHDATKRWCSSLCCLLLDLGEVLDHLLDP